MDAKRQKLHQPTADDQMLQTTEFLSMNDDCVYKIFEWMDLDDICSISDTCKRLKLLGSDYVQRKHADKLLHGIRITTLNGKIQLQPNEKCVWSFSRCFDTVILNVNTRQSLDVDVIKKDLPQFIREYCSEYLRTILFQSTFVYDTFGDSIENILQNVETVAFSTCELEGDYHQILKHCQNLKYLTIDENYGHKIEKLLLETRNPKLEHFSCLYYGRVILTNSLNHFLRQHPNLKRLTWCFHARIREAEISDKTLQCIEMIVKNGRNLQELFLSFDGTYNLESICDKLKVLCDRKHFKRLELDFRYTALEYKLSKMMIGHGHHLKDLKSLLGLHLCDFSDYGSDFLPTLSTMENLRILQLDSDASIKRSRLNSVLLGGLSSLEELHIGALSDFSVTNNFIYQVKSLKIVSVFRCKFRISRLDLPKLNIERKKLDDVSKLIIYLNVYSKKMEIDEVHSLDMVKVEFVNFEARQLNFQNPFIRNTISKR